MTFKVIRVNKEPECPDCEFGALRPKCAFERGGDCPRHEVAREFEQLCGGYKRMKQLLNAKGEYRPMGNGCVAKSHGVPSECFFPACGHGHKCYVGIQHKEGLLLVEGQNA